MTPDTTNPARGGAAGSGRHPKLAASDFSRFKPPAPSTQDKKRAGRHGARAPLRLVHSALPRRIEVRLTALAGLYPYGGVTRSFQLTHRALDELIDHAIRMEAGS